MKWPGNTRYPRTFVSTQFMQKYLVCNPSSMLGASLASAVWPATSRIIYLPFEQEDSAYVVTQMFALNGTAVSGNIDVGIYDEAGTRLVSAGSTAQAGTSTYQTFDVTDTILGRGVFYMAIVIDNTTGTNSRFNPSVAPLFIGWGGLQQASTFPLPATATFASNTTSYLPTVGCTGYTLV